MLALLLIRALKSISSRSKFYDRFYCILKSKQCLQLRNYRKCQMKDLPPAHHRYNLSLIYLLKVLNLKKISLKLIFL